MSLHVSREASPSQTKFDALFRSQLKLPEVAQSSTGEASFGSRTCSVAHQYFSSLNKSIDTVDRMFDGSTASARTSASRTYSEIRKEAARSMFIEAVRPEVEKLLLKYGEKRSFDQVVTFFGFNELFTRNYSSAQANLDLFMVVDTENEALMEEIGHLLQEEVAPIFELMGISMPTSGKRAVDMSRYLAKLSDTEHSLFALAQLGQAEFITGSQANFRRAFSFTDTQLVDHFVNLLRKNGQIEPEEVSEVRNLAREKIEASTPKREKFVRLLRQMACNELHTARRPYTSHETIQTAFSRIAQQRKLDRSAPIAIPRYLGSIVSMYRMTEVDPKRRILFERQIGAAEKLSTVLLNIKCRLDDETTHPLLKMHSGISELTLADFEKMTPSDKRVVAELFEDLDFEINPTSSRFATEAYDAMWMLSNCMNETAKSLESAIAKKALKFVDLPKQESEGWGWGAIAGIAVVVIGGLAALAKYQKWI